MISHFLANLSPIFLLNNIRNDPKYVNLNEKCFKYMIIIQKLLKYSV